MEDPLGVPDPVTEDVLVFDTVEDAEGLDVVDSEGEARPVPVVVLEDVAVFVDSIVCVLFDDEVDVRVPASVRVSEFETLMLGLDVAVADWVFEPRAERVIVGVPVGVLLSAEDRVREGDPVAVFVPPIDRVADRVTGMV